ncbi:hypothetical protein F4778DRAFT_85541 [Xylariomycetidae sp. FL2044]|nr:hypothetical protein F4778DRAFT_85541 [Xylariomycetidae sp. FL2044]
MGNKKSKPRFGPQIDRMGWPNRPDTNDPQINRYPGMFWTYWMSLDDWDISHPDEIRIWTNLSRQDAERLINPRMREILNGDTRDCFERLPGSHAINYRTMALGDKYIAGCLFYAEHRVGSRSMPTREALLGAASDLYGMFMGYLIKFFPYVSEIFLRNGYYGLSKLRFILKAMLEHIRPRIEEAYRVLLPGHPVPALPLFPERDTRDQSQAGTSGDIGRVGAG